MKRWMVRAYAKINLGLRILNRRADGYHDLDTYFLQITLADELFVEKNRRARLELTCNRPEIPIDDDNLCVRAYDLLAQKTGRAPGVRLHLQKNIPAGGGLGGGSSDAAATLMAVNALGHLGLSKNDLFELALQLGSDVPFFLEGGFCRGQGRGEIISPCTQLPPIWVLLIVPDMAVSTASVYKNIKLGLTKTRWNSTFALSKLNCFTKDCDADVIGVNDLESVVFKWHPQLAAVKDNLPQHGAMWANMSGSGSTIFGVFANRQQACAAQEIFRSEYRTWIARPIRWGYENVDSFLR